jgi:hypothetical protein
MPAIYATIHNRRHHHFGMMKLAQHRIPKEQAKRYLEARDACSICQRAIVRAAKRKANEAAKRAQASG